MKKTLKVSSYFILCCFFIICIRNTFSQATPGYTILTSRDVAFSNGVLNPVLNLFIQHKRGLGFEMYLVTEDQWGGGTGNEAADNIREWLKNNYISRNIEYVLLIGNPNPDPGISPVPMKILWVPYLREHVIINQPVASDFYYADLTGNWDLDEDNRYGELPDDFGPDGVDKHFEVVVGRIPYYGEMADLEKILQKTMAYETTFVGNTGWRKNFFLPVAWPKNNYQLGEDIKYNILTPAGPDWTCFRLYPAVNQYDHLPLPPEKTAQTEKSSDIVTQVWQDGIFGAVIFSADHGGDGLASGIINNRDVYKLNDAYPCFTFHASACDNASPKYPNNLAYALLKNGAIATVGATNSCVSTSSPPFTKRIGSDLNMAYEYTRLLVTDQLSCGYALYCMKFNLEIGAEKGNELNWRNFAVFNLYGDPSLGLFSSKETPDMSPEIKVSIKARGTQARGEWPRMELYAGPHYITGWDVNQEEDRFYYAGVPEYLLETPGTPLYVRFPNDSYVADFFDMQRWGTQQGGFWDSQQWMSGDFNGDGRKDMANLFNENGWVCIDIHLSDGFQFSQWRRWLPVAYLRWSDSAQFLAGDFNNDGKDDIMMIHNDGGFASMTFIPSNGSNFRIPVPWGNRVGSFTGDQQWFSGDFNGDSLLDIMSRSPFYFNFFSRRILTRQEFTVYLHNNSGFSTGDLWFTLPGFMWDSIKWLTGDFNNDRRTDLCAVLNENASASFLMYLSNSAGFEQEQRWGTRQGGFWDSQKWMAGDFNGDGFLDLANVFGDNGEASIDVHSGNGSSFPSWGRWSTQQGGFWDAQQWVSGDFDKNGRCDLCKVFYDNGQASLDVHLSPYEDRNLIVDYIYENEVKFQAEDPWVQYILGDTTSGQDVRPGQETMFWTGWLKFPVLHKDQQYICGFVRHYDGSAVPGVTMQGLPDNPGTDSTGFYRAIVPRGWSGTVVPFKPGYDFIPADISYHDVNNHKLHQDYFARSPSLHVQPDPVDFGNVSLGTISSPLLITMTNQGNADMHMGDIMVNSPDPSEFMVQNNNCSHITILPGESACMEMVFSPSEQGDREGQLLIQWDFGFYTLQLKGKGITPHISVNPGGYNFGWSDESVSFYITNTGDAHLAVGQITITGPNADAFTIIHDNCSNRMIDPGSSDFVHIGLSPGNQTGASAFLTIPSDDRDHPVTTVLLTAKQIGNGFFVDSRQRLGNYNSMAAALGDLDGDGDLDAFVGNKTGRTSGWGGYETRNQDTIYMNEGNGIFTLFATNLPGKDTYDVALGDLDNDGWLDIVTSSYICFNDGMTEFVTDERIGELDVFAIVLGDVDADDDLDIFTGSEVLINQGSRQFNPWQIDEMLPQSSIRSVALGDLDNDGDLDAVVGIIPERSRDWRRHVRDGWNRIYFNNGLGGFRDSGQRLGSLDPNQPGACGDDTYSLSLGDVDGDGDLDIVEGNRWETRQGSSWGGNNVIQSRVLLNDGHGTFYPHYTFPTGDTRKVCLADVDNDNDLDLLAADNQGEALLFLNNGQGQFGNHQESGKYQQLLARDTHDLAVGDLDYDGDVDVFFAIGRENEYSFGTQMPNQVWLNEQSGVAVYPEDVNFGLVYTNYPSSPHAIQVMNTGQVDQVFFVEIVGPDAAAFVFADTPPAQTSLKPLEMYTIKIVFSPVFPGTMKAALRIYSQGMDSIDSWIPGIWGGPSGGIPISWDGARIIEIPLTGSSQWPPQILLKQDDMIVPKGSQYNVGQVNIDAGKEIIFSLENISTGFPLILTGSPLIQITGGSSSFMVTQQPVTDTVTGGSSVYFTLSFSPQTTGEHTAVVTIFNNDPDDNPYEFMVTGQGMMVTHSITATAGAWGRIDPSGEVSVDHGDDLIFSIIPDQEYDILNVLVDQESQGPLSMYTFTNVKNDHTIEAVFMIRLYEITGFIQDSRGQPVQNVVLSGFPDIVQTDDAGFYRGVVPSGWSGQIIPQLGNYSFDPENRSYENVFSHQSEHNYTAIPLVQDVYVDKSASGTQDGFSWENALYSIQEAIDLVCGMACKQIHVARGHYVENVILASKTELYGGYPQGGGQRDIRLNETVINGNNRGRVVMIGQGEDIVLDGFTITGGNVQGEDPDNQGGGIFCYGDRNSPVISNCFIIDNIADFGGGIAVETSNPFIRNCRILRNTARQDGGGIFYQPDWSYPVIINCLIAGNRASHYGGGVLAGDYSTFVNCTITDNHADVYGGGIAASYPAIITNTVVWNNTPISSFPGTSTITYSCLESDISGTGNIMVDPRLTEDYHLGNESSCIDSGTNDVEPLEETDIDGYPRIENGCIDMGADEYVDALVLLLPMEDDGGVTSDVSGHGNHGIIEQAVFKNGIGLNSTSVYEFSWSQLNRIRVPHQDSQFVSDQITLEAWVYPTAWDNIYYGYNRIISKYPSYLLRGSANGCVQFEILTENQGYQNILGAEQLALNEWHYLVGTFDGRSLKIYVNGNLKAVRRLPETDRIVDNERPIYIGENPNLAEGFTGLIDNAAVYRAARKPYEIYEIYKKVTTSLVPETGQTLCYDMDGNTIDCYRTGQDGSIHAGHEWPQERFIDNYDGTITDSLTGLMWLQNANTADAVGYDPDGTGNGKMRWLNSLAFIEDLNDGVYPGVYFGYNDWRLPNINELKSLIHTGYNEVYFIEDVCRSNAEWLIKNHFENVVPGPYWSSTTLDNDHNGAWIVSMQDGVSYAQNKNFNENMSYVWPVRVSSTSPVTVPCTGQKESYAPGDDGEWEAGVLIPESRFTNNYDGTVTDHLTGLMWLLNANAFGDRPWEQTFEVIADFNLNPDNYGIQGYSADYSDWRVPNIREFQSLIDYAHSYPYALPDGMPFINVHGFHYWTSTTYAEDVSKGWFLFMENGHTGAYPKSFHFPVWPVRGKLY